MLKRSLIVLSAAAVMGCSGAGVSLDAMRFACSQPTDCVDGFTCLGGTCIAIGSLTENPQDSGSAATDSGATDAGDGGTTDAGNGGTSDAGTTDAGNGTQDAGSTLLANGLSCSANGQCSSSFCRDGVCCNTSCDGSCNTCNRSTSMGTCTNLSAGSPGSPACSGSLVCTGGSACPSTCGSDNDCVSGRSCVSGSCVVLAALTVSVASETDDAEESLLDGTTRTVSTDLELINDEISTTGDQIVGMRFLNITIPKGATIVSATVQFETDETWSSPLSTSLTISGQDVGDASTFVAASDNHNISTRAKTSATVAWNSIPNWEQTGERGADQRTPNIASVIQEIVDRADWASGNDLVILITGSGRRSAVAYDKTSGQPPALSITYSTP